jgi:hypothetical protein
LETAVELMTQEDLEQADPMERVDTETGEVVESEDADPEQEIEKLINSICPTDRDRAYALVAAARKPMKKRKRLPKVGEEDWVALRTIFGNSKVPEAVADVVQEAIQTMIKAGDISETNKWQFLEFVAADYIAENGVVPE